MARIKMLALGHYLQGEAWPDGVERIVVEHNFALTMPGFLEYANYTILYYSTLLAQQGMARLCVLVLPLCHHLNSEVWPE